MLTADHQRLPRTSPESQGMAASAILRFVEALGSQVHEIHSFMLLRHGNVVAEGWWSPYAPQHPHLLFSVSKSFTSTAVGLAVSEGHFALEDRVVSFFPDEAPAESNAHLAAMRVRDLLTMSTGQAVDSWSAMVGRGDGDWIRGFFDVPVVHTPGTHFVYNTGATYMLSAIVQKTTGLKLIDYLEPRLFAPLGIENATWQDSPQGITTGGIGLSIRTEDIARFGQLYLQLGVWQGQQILPEAWVEEASVFQVSNGDDPERDWTQGYGYQFWRCRHGAYRADGAFGQFCIVMPEQDAVLAMTAGLDLFDMQQPLDLLWEMLLPAMQAEPLPEDAEAQRALREKLSSLSLPPVQGEATLPVAAHVSGRTYAVDPNARGIETLSLSFSASGCVVRVKTAEGEETIPCGYGIWEHGETTLFRHHLLFDRMPVASSGAWTADDRYTILIRLYETPFFHTLICHFVGDELMVEARINVSLESLEPLLLTARAV